PGRVPRGRRQVRRGRVVDRVSLACAGPPGRPSVLPHGGGRGAVLGRRENRSDGGKIPILPLVVLRIGFPLETEKKRKNGTRSSRNPGLLPPFVSRISFPCEQAIEQGNKGADFPETGGSSRRPFRESAFPASSGSSNGNSSRNIPETGAPSPGGSGVRTARETLEGGAGGARPGAIAHAETISRSDQRFKPDRDVDSGE